eukprot:651018-Pyramimonas_sp.AAC.1
MVRLSRSHRKDPINRHRVQEKQGLSNGGLFEPDFTSACGVPLEGEAVEGDADDVNVAMPIEVLCQSVAAAKMRLECLARDPLAG